MRELKVCVTIGVEWYFEIKQINLVQLYDNIN